MKRSIVVVNQGSGTAQHLSPDELSSEICHQFSSHGWTADVRFVPAAQLTKALQQAVADSPDALVVGGGDGTVTAAVCAIGDRDLSLGILPLGTFNTMSHDLGTPDELDAAIEVICHGQVQRVDVAQVNGCPFMCLCILGFFANPHNGVETVRLPWWAKISRTMWITVRSYLDYPEIRMSIQTGGETTSLSTRFVGIANNPFEDKAGVDVPQRESLTCGKLALYFATHSTRWGVIRAGLAFIAGRLKNDPDIMIREAESVTINAAGKKALNILLDGEMVRESLPLRFSIHPRRLQVFVKDAEALEQAKTEEAAA